MDGEAKKEFYKTILEKKKCLLKLFHSSAQD
jgi:hypothetical protein